MKISDFQLMKIKQQKISMVTCYDYWSAKIITKSNIDCILVGDSLSMVMHGHPNTLAATVEIMVLHIQAVARGATKQFIIGDMPFCSYRKDLATNMNAIEKIMQAGAQAIKLEGAAGNLELITHVVESGIPVIGHIGMMPQSINALGGFRAQGKDESTAKKIFAEAKALEAAGCFAIVLECIPSALAQEITEALLIPTIGIGAGPHTSGQVLILQDLLGMNDEFKPKFLKTFLNGTELIQNALNQYDYETKNVIFPNVEQHTY